MGLRAASAVGGGIGWAAGKVSKKRNANARAGMAIALPHLSEAEHARLIRKMWRNIGRNIGETVHMGFLHRRRDARFRITGAAHVEQARAGGRPVIFFAAHLSNWEVLTVALLKMSGRLIIGYRHIDNPHLDRLVRGLRESAAGITYIPDTRPAYRRLLRAIEGGASFGLLIDQRSRQGEDVEFFGKTVKARSTIARLGRRYDLPLIPCRIRRRAGAPIGFYDVEFSPPVRVARTDDAEADVAEAMRAAYVHLEKWVEDTPADWFWVHHRFR